MNSPGPLDWIAGELHDLESAGLRRRRKARHAGESGPIDFSTNDYLGLAADSRLAEAAARAAQLWGWGAGASPVVTGRSAEHAELEQAIADFEGVESALLFPSGYAANSAVVPALAGAGDAIYADARNHASLIDGCRLSRAERFVYAHNDTAVLRELLAHNRGRFRRQLIVTDGLFSMDGDFAPLAALGDLAEEFGTMLLVDEAHATGVWGPNGRGSVEHASQQSPRLEKQVSVRIGTLSKALGSVGGFVAGSGELIDWLFNRARAYVFSTASPHAVAAASREALRIAIAEPDRRRQVIRSAEALRGRLQRQGWRIGDSQSQIVPVVVGDPNSAVDLSRMLAGEGFVAPAIRPPSVPEGASLLRISVTAGHTESDIDGLANALGSPVAAE